MFESRLTLVTIAFVLTFVMIGCVDDPGDGKGANVPEEIALSDDDDVTTVADDDDDNDNDDDESPVEDDDDSTAQPPQNDNFLMDGLEIGKIYRPNLSIRTVMFNAKSSDEKFYLALYSVGEEKSTEYDYTVKINGVEYPSQQKRSATTSAPRAADSAYADLSPFAASNYGKIYRDLKARGYNYRTAAEDASEEAELPAVGDIIKLTVPGATGGGDEVDAKVLAVSDELILTNDITTNNPSGELSTDDEKLQEMIDYFEEVILPRERFFFHEESDVNNDGHVTVLFTPKVPEIGAAAYVVPYDLITDDKALPPYVVSNKQEIIYCTPPNMSGGPMSSARYLAEVLAHEFNHQIYFYAKFLLNDNADDDENPYVTEGMSAMAEDLTGFSIGVHYMLWYGFRQSDFSYNDISQFMISYIYDRDESLRSAGYLFLRYLFDQAGGDEMDDSGNPLETEGVKWMREFFVNPTTAPEILAESTGRTREELIEDFALTTMLDGLTRVDEHGRLVSRDRRYHYSVPYEDPITGLIRGFSWYQDEGLLQFDGPSIHAVEQARGSLRAGGFELLSFQPGEAGDTVLEISSEVLDDLRLALVRVE